MTPETQKKLEDMAVAIILTAIIFLLFYITT